MYLRKGTLNIYPDLRDFSPSKVLQRLEVKCLEDGTRQMAEDVLLVGSHVVGGTQWRVHRPSVVEKLFP